MGHGAVKQKPFRWIVRIVIIGTILFELLTMAATDDFSPFAQTVLMCMAAANSILLFIHGRKVMSALLTWLDGVASLRVITVPLMRNRAPVAAPIDVPQQPQNLAPKELRTDSLTESQLADKKTELETTTHSGSHEESPSAEQKDSPADVQTSPPVTAQSSANSTPGTPTPILNKTLPPFLQGFVDKIVFVPTSYPNMVGMFVYIVALGSLLQAVSPASMDFPSIPIPLPVSLQQLFSYNGLGLVMLSFCGVGIFVSRDWKAAFKRLGWEKPKLSHVGIGLGLVVFSFCYDLVWALITHAAPGQDIATKLSGYNSGTFASGADLSASILLAFATAICAGVGEETLTRGALQPALGIVPAAILHGVLHAQFSHAPILIIQIAIWSIVFGIVRRFTSTTTTIIGHAGFNFVTTFLFAFNP